MFLGEAASYVTVYLSSRSDGAAVAGYVTVKMYPSRRELFSYIILAVPNADHATLIPVPVVMSSPL